MSRGADNHGFEDIEMAGTRASIERNIKPLFDRHGSRGILVSDLKREMRGNVGEITAERLDELLRRTDHNDNERITFEEFKKTMTSLREPERGRFREAVRLAVINVIPARAEKNFLSLYSCLPPPLFMIAVSIAEIIVFGVYAAELANMGTPVTTYTGAPMYSPLIYLPTKRHEAWRFLTYMLIHQGWLHLLFNILFQLLFGIPLEMIHKWWRVMILYFCGVIAGSLAHSLFEHNTALVGASGGGYAVLGAHVASVAMNWNEMNYKCLDKSGKPGACTFIGRILLSAPFRLGICLALFIPDTGLAIYRRINAPVNERVGVAAHIGGFLTGLLLGIPVVRNMERLPPEMIARWVTLTVFLIFVFIAVLFNGLYPGFPPADFT